MQVQPTLQLQREEREPAVLPPVWSARIRLFRALR
jgi:hypothetical protein